MCESKVSNWHLRVGSKTILKLKVVVPFAATNLVGIKINEVNSFLHYLNLFQGQLQL